LPLEADQVYMSSNGGIQFSSRTVIAADELRAPFPPIIVDPVVPTSKYVAAGVCITRPMTATSGPR